MDRGRLVAGTAVAVVMLIQVTAAGVGVGGTGAAKLGTAWPAADAAAAHERASMCADLTDQDPLLAWLAGAAVS